MISTILGVLGSGGLGGILGVIGSAFTAFMEYKNKKLAIEEARMNREYDLKEQEAEVKHAEKLAMVEAQKETDLSADENFRASHGTVTALDIEPIHATGFMAGFLLFTEGLRRATRPVLTWYMTFVVTALAVYMTWRLYHLGVDANTEGMIEMLKYIINSTVTVFCTAVTWWFGSRYNRPKFGVGDSKTK